MQTYQNYKPTCTHKYLHYEGKVILHIKQMPNKILKTEEQLPLIVVKIPFKLII